MELTPLQPVQIMSLAIAVLMFFTVLMWARIRFRGHYAYWIGPFMFSAHAILFYGVIVAREVGIITTGSLTVWSAYLRLHGLLTLWGLLIAVWWNERRKSKVVEEVLNGDAL